MPIHPSLIHFPIALLTVGAIASVLFRFLRNRSGERWGVYSLLTGWALTLPALISGIIDKNKIVPNSIAEPVADLHTSLMVSMWIIFGVALYLYYIWRKKEELVGAKLWFWFGLLLLGMVILAIAGHQGARLVYEYGVGGIS